MKTRDNEATKLDDDIRRLTLGGGADHFGVADLGVAYDAIMMQGGESIAKFPRAISIGINMPDAIIDLLPHVESIGVAQRYQSVYLEVNQSLDVIAANVVARLQRENASALAISASRMVDAERLCGSFSHKMAAHLARLGWIGKSSLLITPQVGPRVRWATVLTDAQLEAGHVVDNQCGGCDRCVNVCPAKAFTGNPFSAGEHRDERFLAGKCTAYREEMKLKMGCSVLCGLCVSVCPHGKNTSNR
jgi:epoxyqueuosine reductase QueG